MRQFRLPVTLVVTFVGLYLGLSAQAAGGGSSAQDNAFFAGPGTHGATLNGEPLLPGTAILQGETVETGPNGVVVMTPTHGAGGVLQLAGNSSATVHTGAVDSAVGTDQLMINKGNALVTGSISVTTPQGEIFQPATNTTSFVVNAAGQQTSMGVLSGAVNTISPPRNGTGNTPAAAPVTVPAGAGIQVNSTITGQVRLTNIRANQVVRPAASDAMPQAPTASQSQ